MTDAISSVSSTSSASSASASSSTAISDDTKKKLLALGLDPSKYTTESQAEEAITEAQAKQQPQQAQKSGSSSFATIKTEVQELASKMGLNVGTNDKTSDILSKISDEINELQSTAGSDPTKASQANAYQSQYTTISSELSQLEAARNMTGATALGNYNKAAQGLAA